MSDHDFAEIWRLPGPGGYVREVAGLVRGGQHVLAIVPKYIAEHAGYSNALSVAIANEFEDTKRVFPNSSQGSLAAAFGFEVSSDFDQFPTTLSELIVDKEVVGRTFICNAVDLDSRHADELPNFLRRLDNESRSIAKSDRGTMVFVVSRDQVPADSDSVTMAQLWYWDRVARWDVAAFISRRISSRTPTGVLAEARVESILELARWDFSLAAEMANLGTEDEAGLASLLSGLALATPPKIEVRRTGKRQPPESARDAWDQGLIDSWHGELGYKPAALSSADGRHSRLTWSAQARVFLPWIEVRRVRIERIVRDRLGAARMEAAIEEFSTRFPGIEDDPSNVEIATLSRIISARLGGTEPRLRTTARALRDARNRLSHLMPLPQPALSQLVSECAWLEN